jgi:beta-glucosidase
MASTHAFASDAQTQAQVSARSAPVINADGLRFKDLNRNGQVDPYEDWRLTAAERARDLIARMSIEEKAGMMMHAANSGYFGAGGTVLRELAPPPPGALKPPVNVSGVPGFDRADKPSPFDLILTKQVRWISTSPGGAPADAARWANAIQEIAEGSRLGIPVVLAADPVHTTNRLPGGALPPPERRKITSSWPDQIGLAAIGDVKLVEQFGRIAATEYRALGFRMILNPMADLSTEPRWNRIPGTFGEDARVAAAMTAAYIRGVQGETLSRDSVLAVVKHFPGDGPVQAGFDPHNPYGRFAVYPTGRMDYHLIPFRAAIDAHVAAVMPAYAIPKGIDTVGMNFSKKIVTDMLRGAMKFDGIVLTDWLHAMPWGVEHLSKQERTRMMIDAGVDQLGGEHDPSHIVELTKQGRITGARLDASMRRLLEPMFTLGLFEDPYVDPDSATTVVDNARFHAAGEDAQRRAIVLLKNEAHVLPLQSKSRVYLSGFAAVPAALASRAVADAASADVMVVKVNAPYALRKDGTNFFTETHEGTLSYAGAENAADLDAIRAAARSGKPVVVVMSMERPAVLSEFIDGVRAFVATFGSNDQAVADILTGAVAPSGKLPFDLPADNEAVERQAEDAPHDFARTLFRTGFGLGYASRAHK